MIKNYLLLFVGASATVMHAQSPISLSNSNMPGSGDTLRYTNVQINSLGSYTQTGTNFIWDFTSVTSTTSDVRNFKSSLQTPYAFYFLGLNEYGEKMPDAISGNTGSITISNYYNFYKKSSSNPNAFLADGVGLTISSVPLAAYYTNKDELYNFPLTYPKYDSTTFRFATPSTTLLPIVYTRTGSRATRVDGWGTVSTPYGTDACIRLVSTQYSQDTMAVQLSTLIPVPIKIGFTNNQRSYQWFTTTSKIPFFEVSGSLIGNLFTVTQVRYRGYNKYGPVTAIVDADKDISAMNLYPNPVKDKLWLLNTGTKNMQVEILDVNGRLIRKTESTPFENMALVDVEDLSTGLYVIKLQEGQKPVYLKFIKE